VVETPHPRCQDQGWSIIRDETDCFWRTVQAHAFRHHFRSDGWPSLQERNEDERSHFHTHRMRENFANDVRTSIESTFFSRMDLFSFRREQRTTQQDSCQPEATFHEVLKCSHVQFCQLQLIPSKGSSLHKVLDKGRIRRGQSLNKHEHMVCIKIVESLI
jgi:hypothetical protein